MLKIELIVYSDIWHYVAGQLRVLEKHLMSFFRILKEYYGRDEILIMYTHEEVCAKVTLTESGMYPLASGITTLFLAQ